MFAYVTPSVVTDISYSSRFCFTYGRILFISGHWRRRSYDRTQYMYVLAAVNVHCTFLFSIYYF